MESNISTSRLNMCFDLARFSWAFARRTDWMGRRRGEHLGKFFYTFGPCTSLYLSPNSKARMTSQRQLRVVNLRLSKILTAVTVGLSSMLVFLDTLKRAGGCKEGLGMWAGTAHCLSVIVVPLRRIRSTSNAQSTMRRNADGFSFQSRCLSNWFDGRAYSGRVVIQCNGSPCTCETASEYTPRSFSQVLWTVYTATLSIHPPASIPLL